MATTNLIVGDFWDDGHGKFDVYRVTHNALTEDFLKESHEQGCMIVGINLKEEVACDYEQSYLTDEQYHTFAKYFDINNYVSFDNDDKNWFEDGPEGFVNLYMEIAKLAEPSLSWTIEGLEGICIGGYGFGQV